MGSSAFVFAPMYSRAFACWETLCWLKIRARIVGCLVSPHTLLACAEDTIGYTVTYNAPVMISGQFAADFWINDGAGQFFDVAPAVGVTDTYDGRAVALADF